MALEQYLREELLEEVEYGYVSEEEGARRLARFDELSSGSLTLEMLRASRVMLSVPDPLTGDPAVWLGENASGIVTEMVRSGHDESTVDGFLAQPIDSVSAPGVLVVHENQGLTPYVRDVARRLAQEGFVALAPDLLTSVGGTDSFADHTDATAALRTLDMNQLVEQLKASVTTLIELDGVDATHIGLIGFCFGGGMVWQLLTVDDRIDAAVPFYGAIPPLEAVPAIRASVLGIYAELDDRINAGIPAIEKAMGENHKTFEKVIFNGAQHGFHNDTHLDRYHAEAAQRAWARALEWLHRHLGSEGK